MFVTLSVVPSTSVPPPPEEPPLDELPPQPAVSTAARTTSSAPTRHKNPPVTLSMLPDVVGAAGTDPDGAPAFGFGKRFLVVEVAFDLNVIRGQ
jgi:hypothetical protein